MPEREGVGRRAEDQKCADHEKRLDAVVTEASKQSGWLKSSAVVFTLAATVLSWAANSINAKLDGISQMLGKNDVTLMQHAEQIKNVQADIKEIQERHRYLDQNGVVKRVR